jgi:hypothetical protein
MNDYNASFSKANIPIYPNSKISSFLFPNNFSDFNPCPQIT